MPVSATTSAVIALLLMLVVITSNAAVIPLQDDRFTVHSIYRTLHRARKVSFAAPLSRMHRARPSNPPRIIAKPEQQVESQDKPALGPIPPAVPHGPAGANLPIVEPSPASVELSPTPALDELFAPDASPAPTSLPCGMLGDSVAPSPVPLPDEIFGATV